MFLYLSTKHSVDLFIQNFTDMKKIWVTFFVVAFAAAMLVPSFANAQKGEDEKDKGKVKKDVQQVIITTKGDKDNKYTVEINGDKVTINGKPIDDYKDKDGDIKVRLNKLKDIESLTFATPGKGSWGFSNGNNNLQYFNMDNNRAMLGVSTEASDKGGVEVKDVTKESAAEKIGLKKGDIITKIGDDKIENPDDLSEAVQKHKPGEKVDIKYIRDGKEQKATAELGKWKGGAIAGAPLQNFNMDFNFDDLKMPVMPRAFNGQGFSWSGNGPRLGISVQDTDDGKGVKVIEVDGESNAAKAGIKEDDVITQIDDKAVNGVDEIAKLLKEKKENPTVRFQLTRNGKSQNIEVKMPRKIKTADL
jgi:serine protease Do